MQLIPNSTVAIVTGGYGVATINYADPANTVKVQQIDTGVLTRGEGGSGRTTVIDSKTALVVGSCGVCVLNVADPYNVQKLVKIDTGVLSRERGHGDGKVTVVGTRAIVVGHFGLAVLDLSEPANAKKVANLMWDTPDKTVSFNFCWTGGRLTLMPDGRYALMTTNWGPMVIDLLDIDKPVVVSCGPKGAKGVDTDGLRYGNYAYPVLIDGYAYIAGRSAERGELVRIDMRNPARPAKAAGRINLIDCFSNGYENGRIYQIGAQHILIIGGRSTQVHKIPPPEMASMPTATATMPTATASMPTATASMPTATATMPSATATMPTATATMPAATATPIN